MNYNRYKDWLLEAEDDLTVAEELLKLSRYSKVCYFSQQAAEKALKAFLIYYAGIYDPTHSITKLLELAEKHGVKLPQNLKRSGKILDRHYIPTRYPNAWPAEPPFKHYDKIDAMEALNHAKKIMQFIKEKIRENT